MFKSIVTHRAINIIDNKKNEAFALESNRSAFLNQLQDGFGLEFDIQPLKNDSFVVTHNNNLKKLTNNKDLRLFADINYQDFKSINFEKNSIFFLDDILDLIDIYAKKICFLHLKHSCQEKKFLDRLIQILLSKKSVLKSIVIFDLRPKSAIYLKTNIPELNLAASVSHEYDIKRFGLFTGNTLLSLNEIISYKDLYNWAWMDEWDTKHDTNPNKSFVNENNISLLKNNSFNVAVVSPELHGSSPGLLANEEHQSSKNILSLKEKWTEWAMFEIEAICSDYANEIRNMLIK